MTSTTNKQLATSIAAMAEGSGFNGAHLSLASDRLARIASRAWSAATACYRHSIGDASVSGTGLGEAAVLLHAAPDVEPQRAAPVALADHTQGRLTTREDGFASNSYTLDCEGRWLFGILHNGEQHVPTQRENVRRLAACWNACDGIPTDALVKAADDLTPVFQLLMETWAERDKLKTALGELQANPNDPRAHRVALDALTRG
ncbi:hypothetical protein HNP48_002266 [Acidovorax soli]|uniref:Uncharacterized protein n=1 Tax=Acidovorax soli TaxID=592050 RepID=A0A7X0PD44_9BURK|nr:hypothetical protein [Acidovorax soli]MBB6559599.1 hypothetical protein [Acidovorax soli]